MAAERDSGGINNNGSVKVHEVCKVPPFSDHSTAAAAVSNTTTTLSLTYFDTQWFNFSPVDVLLFYEIKDLTWVSFNSEILPKLKHSLSLTLLHYLPLAGHLMWPPHAEKPALYYHPKNEGVSVTVAESNADFDLLSGDGIRKAVEFHPLAPQLPTSEDNAEVIAVQITLFPNHGFSICISVHHTIFDGTSTQLFIKSWAYFCKQLQQRQKDDAVALLPERLTPCFDRTLIKDPRGIDMVYLKHRIAWTRSDPNTRSLKAIPFRKVVDSNLVRSTFELTREDLNKLKHRLLLVNKEQLHHSSTFVLICAHVFVCLVQAKAKDANTTVTFLVHGDCRSRLDPPLPVNYFGNCVAVECVVAKASDFMQENGIAFVAEKLNDSINAFKGDAILGSEDKLVRRLQVIKEMGEESILITLAGTNRFDYYGSDFGWRKPKKVEIVSIDIGGAISMMENKDGGGVEVGVVMNKQQMQVFASLLLNGLNDKKNISTEPRSRI